MICPDTWQVVSNMAPDADRGAGRPGTERWHFPPTPLMSTYITAVAAGPYHVVRAEHDGIPLGIYCRQSLASYLDPDEIFEVTRQGFDFFHETFGVRYPFGKYDQLFVPEFKAGAMENAGCVTFLEDYVFRSRVTDSAREARAETILHEMAHMWFGDLVTMRWWDDLWLNESFATWAGTVAQAEATRWTQRVDHVRPGVEGVGLPPGPAAVHAPDRGGHPRTSRPSRSTSTASPTPRARPSSSSWWPTSAGRTSWPACGAYFAEHAWGNATPRRPARRAGRQASGRDLAVLVEAVAGDRRGEHAAAGAALRRRRPVHLVRGARRRPRPATRCCGRTGSRSGCTTGPGPG